MVAILPPRCVSSAQDPNSVTTFVLVHGAFHGGWCWRDFTPELEAKGHRVFTPTLTGLGDRFDEITTDVGLSTHIADVLGLYRAETLSDTVLLGHSYGGAVVTGVADAMPDALSTLIYLDAVIPENGKSVLDLQHEERRQEFLAKAKNFNGWQIPAPPVAFYGITDPVQQQWGDANCVPQPLKCFAETSALTGDWTRVADKAYIRCTKPPLPYMDKFQSFAEQQADWDVYEMATGHDCMVTEPQKLADILLRYAV